MIRRLGFFWTLLLLAFGAALPAQAQYDWRQTQGQTDDLNAVTVASSGNASARYVAVGAVGLILSSPDGGNWTIRSSGTTGELFGVAYGNISPSNTPLYLAVGVNGTVLESSDGHTWLPETPVTNSTLRGVIFQNNEFVAFGDSGLVMSSPDGVTWTTGTTGTTGSVHAMTYLATSQLFVAVGAGGIFLTSPDGLTWTTSQTGTAADLNSIAAGNGLFVAGGSGGVIMTASISGNFGALSIGSWQQRTSGTANTITSMVYNGTTFVGVTASSETLLSNGVSAGVNWVRGDTGAFTELNALAYDSTDALFVTVGDIGINPLNTSYILTSLNAINWTSHASATTIAYTKVANNGSLFVAVGDDEEIASSPDGVIWNIRHDVASGQTLNAVYSTGARTVAVGNGIAGSSGQPPVLLWSDNGISWSNGAIASFNGNVSLTTFRNVTGVANNGTIWLGVQNDAGDSPNDPISEAAVITSTDGKTWNGFPAFDAGAGAQLLNPFIGVVWEPVSQLFVAILGPSSSTGLAYYNIRTSPDGVNWSSPKFIESATAMTDIKLVNGQVVVLFDSGIAGMLVLTPGGVGVLNSSFPFLSTDNQMRDVTYGADPLGQNTTVLVGDDTDNDIDAMFTETDASITGSTIWNSLNPDSGSVLEALDYLNGTFVGVGTGGSVYVSKAWGPSLSAPIVNEGGVLGGNTTFTVQPLPFQPAGFLSYQWQSYNGTTTTWSNVLNGVSSGTTYSGNTTPILGVENITLANVVPYRVLVTNGNGTTLISNNATITLGVAPVITQAPVSVGSSVGGSVTFSVVATGTPSPTFRWRRNGVLLTDDGGNVTGSNTSTLVLSNVQLASLGLQNSGGTFSVDVTNIVGSASASANLTVGSLPAIVLQPLSQNPTIGGPVTFTSSATGTPSPAFQWYLNGVAVANGGAGNISGSTSPTLTIGTVQFANLGNYTVVATNTLGNATSNVATLLPTVPLVTTPPGNNTVVAGATVTMNVTAVGLPTLVYQWLVNGVALQDGSRITGSGTTSLAITDVQGSDAGNYTVKVSNGNGNVTSAPGLLQVSPAIEAAPANTTVTVGGSAQLSVTADGSGNVTYQWFFNGVAINNSVRISGNTTPTLNISGVLSSDAGNYTVKVTNVFGNVTSIPAVLTVLVPSSVATGMDWREMEGELDGVTVAAGGNATNLYVAVGNIGTLLTSPDGSNWTLRSTGTTEELFGTAFGNFTNGNTKLYLVVGDGGVILQSSDGVSWVPQAPVTSSTLRGVIFANNEFVAFGDGGLVMSSPDGMTWTQGTTGTSGSIRGMAYLPTLGEFVAVGDGGLFLTSVDGLAWGLGQTGVTANLNSIAFGNGLFVAVGDSGNIVTASFGSSSGGNWQTRNSGTANNITGVIFDGTKFLGVTSSSETVVSSDGVNWARGDTGFYTELTALAYDSANVRYVTVGDIGINPLGTSYILTSTDGNTWAEHASAQTLDLNAVTHGMGTFVTVGANESINTSPDGVLWTVHIRSLRPVGLNAVAFGAGEFMAVGDGVLSSIDATAYRSFDGVNWSFMTMPTTNTLHGVVKGPGNVWVAVGEASAEGNGTAGAVVLQSLNQGASWSISQMPFTNPFHGIVYDSVAGEYVAILGPSTTDKVPADVIAISPDAQNWTFIASTTAFQFSRIERDNGFDVAVATDGKIFVVDPVALSVTVPFTSTANVLRDVTYGNDAAGTPTWVVVGDDAFNDIDAMFTNTANNPATSSWNSLNPQAFSGLQGLDYSNGTFVAVGDNGRIFISRAWAPAMEAAVVSQNGVLGGNATFTLEPSPTEPAGYLTYQWQDFVGNTTWTNLVNGAKYSGVTTPLMTVSNIVKADALPYRVLVTGSGTTLTSNNATIVLSTPPVIVQAPVSVGTVLGGSVTFSVVATGSPAPTYNWRLNGALLTDGGNVTGSNTSTLVLTNVQVAGSGLENSAGTYTVTATNGVGSVSASANLTVGSAPVILTQPVGQNPIIGGSVAFGASASGVPLPTYQWYLNGLALSDNARISGSATNRLTISPVQLVDLGNYTVVATNSVGNATSNVAAFLPTLPLVTASPGNNTVAAGTTVTMSVTAVGLPTLSYQWLLNGSPVQNGSRTTGAQTTSLMITGVQGSDAGSYTVLVSNGNGNVTSGAGILQVGPSIAAPPANTTVTVGENAQLSVRADGSGNVTYQWMFDGNIILDSGRISGNTTPTLNIIGAQTSDAGNYSVEVTNALGNVTSINATLTVLVPSAVRTGMDWREMEGELDGVALAEGGNATNLYVAVGNIGTLLTSPDGSNWTLRSTGTTDELFGAAFGLVANGTTPVYLAVGEQGEVLQSSDGVSWVPQVPVTNSTLRGVIFANNVFVAFGDGGLVMSSPDGVTWTIGTTGTTGSVRGMSFLPSLNEFVAVGDAGLFLTSVDGLAWTLGQTGATVNLNGVAFGNGLFVAVGDSGNIVTASFGASNGGNWQTRTSGTANNITGVIFDGVEFLGVTSSSETVVSSDGVHWARGDTGFYTELTGLLYDSTNFRYVAVGHIGINPLGTSYILTSTDSNTWAEHASAQTLDLNAVTHGMGTFVTVGANESINTSPDGVIWTVHIRSLRPVGLNAVAFGAGEFMAVGDGVLNSINAAAYRSFDGTNWSTMSMPTTNSLHGVAKGPGTTWEAVGEATAEGNGTAGAVVLQSTNQGASWSVTKMGFTNPFHGIVYDPVAGQYVAILGPSTTDVTPTDVIAISPDGLSWTFLYATTEVQFSRIERDNGFDVAVATDGRIFVVDPAALSVTVPFTSTANVLRDVTYGNDAAGTPTWVVVGDDSVNDIDAMFTNTANNPATSSWNSLNPQAFSGLQGLDYNNGTFVAVGDGGRIFISRPWAPSIAVPLVDQKRVCGGQYDFCGGIAAERAGGISDLPVAGVRE